MWRDKRQNSHNGPETPIKTGPELTPKTMVAAVKDAAKDWDYDRVSKSNSSQGHGEEIQKAKRSIVMRRLGKEATAESQEFVEIRGAGSTSARLFSKKTKMSSRRKP